MLLLYLTFEQKKVTGDRSNGKAAMWQSNLNVVILRKKFSYFLLL